MPFDGTHFTGQQQQRLKHIGSLRDMGLAPIPTTVVEHYKKLVVSAFAMRGLDQKALVRIGMAKWRTLTICEYADFSEFAEAVLQHPESSSKNHQWSAAPQPIIDLVRTVKARLPESIKPSFNVQYFDEDPIVGVSYLNSYGVRREEHLGIWDKGEVVKIAQIARPTLWSRITRRFR